METRDQLSPSYTDSAIDIELPNNASRSYIPDAYPLPDRFAKLAHQVSEHTNLSEDDCLTIHRCLDTIESLLDPRPRVSQEIAKHRPQSLHTANMMPTTSTHHTCNPHTMNSSCASAVKDAAHIQLTVLLSEVTALNAELQERRKESYHIYDLFNLKCQRLGRRINELEGENNELQDDILEDSIELEGLRGTVRGLENWVERWRQQHDMALAKAANDPSRQKKRRRWGKRKDEKGVENDSEVLIEGITAWMRGWKDVEQGFQLRERRRNLEREKRRTLRTNSRGEDDILN